MEKSLGNISETKRSSEFTKTEEINGVTTRMRVEEVENGFIINVSKYGRDTSKKNSEYLDITKRYISTENPLEIKEKKSLKEEINEALQNIKL